MPGKARAVAAPRGGAVVITGPQNQGYRLIAGSMGTASEGAPAAPPLSPAKIAAVPTVEAFEPGADIDARVIAEREAAEGLISETALERMVNPPVVMDLHYSPPISLTPGSVPHGWKPPPREDVDLSPLPAKFALDVERKDDGWWVVRAARVHPGLFVAGDDLGAALGEAVEKLAEIVRLDGAKGRRGK